METIEQISMHLPDSGESRSLEHDYLQSVMIAMSYIRYS